MRVIFCYHKVGPIATEGQWLNVEPATLAEHIAILKKWGFTFRRIQDIGQTKLTDKVAFLTFDDCYESALTYGVAVLDREKVPGSFYAVTDLIGKTSEWNAERAGKLASMGMLKSAHAGGHEIGNHTTNHPWLANLDYPGKLAAIREARSLLEFAGLTQHSFCYPYGSLDAETVSVVEECGYQLGITLRRGPITGKEVQTLLPRVTMSYSDRKHALIYKLRIKPILDVMQGR